MGTFQSIEEARAYFTGDRFAACNGMRIDRLSDGGCVCSMEVGPDHRNALGGIMGGVIYTLADFAFAVASNHDGGPTVALEAKINYLSASGGSRLIAEARRVKSGRSTCVFQVAVTDDLGAEIALFLGTGYRVRK